MPELDFLPESVETERGFIKVDDYFQTSDPKIFAVGDAVKLGLLTDAIGSGRKAAAKIDAVLGGRDHKDEVQRRRIEYSRVKLDNVTRARPARRIESCASMLVLRHPPRLRDMRTICPQGAISRELRDTADGFEMVVDPDKCIGCGFCAGACPCGVWNLVANEPIE